MSTSTSRYEPPKLTTCDKCELHYYLTNAPHVCAEWTTRPGRTTDDQKHLYDDYAHSRGRQVKHTATCIHTGRCIQTGNLLTDVEPEPGSTAAS